MSLLQYCCDNVLQKVTNHRKLSKLTWQICHVSFDRFTKSLKSVKTDWWLICHVSFDSSIKLDRFSGTKSLWPVPWCPFSVSSDNQLFQQYRPTRGKKNIPPFPPSIQFSLGYLLKNPSLYSQKTRIPGWRECVGVIIPSPCTLNRTFTGT